MINLVFLSPNFPSYYYKFCKELKNRGVNVLVISDISQELLSANLKENITHYYYVSNLNDYDLVYRGVAFYISQYGRINYIESQNEYWLETEARLRSDFNILGAFNFDNISSIKNKSEMKKIYQDLNIPCARYHILNQVEDALEFIKLVGYPLVVKPNSGVGADSTYKINNRDDFNNFIINRNPHISFILEEYVDGHVETYDGLANKDKEVLFASSHVLLNSIMDTVNKSGDIAFYNQNPKGKDIEKLGKRLVKAFDSRKRFFHFEFFRLDSDKEGLGKKGDLVGLEINMRAPGGLIPEIMSYAYQTNVYGLWADMLVYDKLSKPVGKYNLVGYVGLRDGLSYKLCYQQVKAKYPKGLLEYIPIDKIFSKAMGDHVYLLKSNNLTNLFKMINTIRELK